MLQQRTSPGEEGVVETTRNRLGLNGRHHWWTEGSRTGHRKKGGVGQVVFKISLYLSLLNPDSVGEFLFKIN